MENNTYFKFCATIILLCFCLYTVFIITNITNNLDKELEYTTGFSDGLKACRARLEGMSVEEIFDKYYKYKKR